MATRTIYLVRHGEYDWDDQPSPNKGLTALGLKQARLTAKRLRSLPITAVYSSDLTRAVETAEVILGELDGVRYEKSRILRECIPSIPLNPRPNSIFARVSKEHVLAGRKQADSVLARHFRAARGQNKHEIIVSHGNLIRYLICRVIGGPEDSWRRLRTLNCGISVVTVESNGRGRVESYNDVGHLPPKLTTAGTSRPRPTRQ